MWRLLRRQPLWLMTLLSCLRRLAVREAAVTFWLLVYVNLFSLMLLLVCLCCVALSARPSVCVWCSLPFLILRV